MSSRVLEPQTRHSNESPPSQRLIVTRRSGGARGRYAAVGYLEERSGAYEFAYLRSAATTPGFVPLPGFSNLHRRYRQHYLFPLFAERVMSPRRPDRVDWLRALDLDADADAIEILARSGGRRHGDAIEMFRAPRVDGEGRLRGVFLVHGVRHMEPDPSHEIAGLRRGAELTLQIEAENDYNPSAVVVLSARGTRLGYIPDPLAEFVSELFDVTEPLATVRVANGPEVVPHLRLLIAVTADVPTGYQPLDGPEWEPAA